MTQTAKHTPGPWTAVTHEPEENISHAVVTGNNRAIPICKTGRWDLASAADTRLIAAAPDLLAACEAAIEDASPVNADYLSAGIIVTEAAYDAMRAAIAKARTE